MAVCGAPSHSKTICNLKCIYSTHTHTHIEMMSKISPIFMMITRKKAATNLFIGRILYFVSMKTIPLLATASFANHASCVQLNCKWNIEMIMNLITLWKQAKEQVDRKERSDHSLKRWNLVRAAIYFSSPRFISLILFFFFCTNSRILIQTRSSQTSLSFSIFGLSNARCMPTALVFTNHHYSYSFYLHLFFSFSNTRSTQMRRPSTHSRDV